MGGTMRKLVGALAGAVVIALAATPAVAAGDAARGESVYTAKCGACHSPDANRVGPMHRGVYGRTAGSVPGFSYSAAVKDSSVVWEEDTLDQWLTDPQALIPGQRMNFRLSQPQDRADVIAYLRTLQ
jgi:cytochrome c